MRSLDSGNLFSTSTATSSRLASRRSFMITGSEDSQADGLLPDFEAAQLQVAAALETVCRVLDGWAALDPDVILDPKWCWKMPEL